MWTRGTITEALRDGKRPSPKRTHYPYWEVDSGQVVGLPLNKPEGLIRQTKTSFFAKSFEDPFITVIKQKKSRKTRHVLK